MIGNHPSTDAAKPPPPRVSIVVPNYNHEQYLAERLDSILEQTFTDWELIILDDASTDGSRRVIERYLADPRVRFHPSEKNSGSTFIQWRRGVELARGEFVWLAESDDAAKPGFLAALVELLDQDPAVGLAYCQSQCIGPGGEELGSCYDWTEYLDPEKWKTVHRNAGRDEALRFMLWRNTIPNASAAVFRRTAYEAVDRRPEQYRLAGDWLVWLSMLKACDVAFTPAELNLFRRHSNTVRGTTSRDLFLDEMSRVQRVVVRDFNPGTEVRKALARQKLAECLSQIREGSPQERRARTFQALKRLLPFFWLEPAVIAGGFLRRHHTRAT